MKQFMAMCEWATEKAFIFTEAEVEHLYDEEDIDEILELDCNESYTSTLAFNGTFTVTRIDDKEEPSQAIKLAELLDGNTLTPLAVNEVYSELLAKRYIGAIKALRDHSVPKLFLKEAKHSIDLYAENTKEGFFNAEGWLSDATMVSKENNGTLAAALHQLISNYGMKAVLSKLSELT